MKNTTPTLKEYLRLFDLVLTKGKKVENIYEYEGVSVWHDFDGYTCFIKYKELTLTLLFHGRYYFDYQDEALMKAFLDKHQKLLLSTD